MVRRFSGANRLTLRLSLAIAVLVTGLLGIGQHLLANHHLKRMVDARRQAAELQNRILESALQHQMLEKKANGALIGTILREVGSQPEVTSVMILNHNGIIRQSSRPSLVGQALSRDSSACQVCHSQPAVGRQRWTILDLPEGPVLRTVRPIENRVECHACHAPENRMNGILIVDQSLAPVYAQVNSDRWWMAGTTAVLGVVLLASVGLILRRLILARLVRLGRAARAIAAGDFSIRAQVASDDMIDRLALDFNNMADAVLGLVTEVKQRESQLANVMNSVDDGLVVLDREFKIVAANHAFCRRFSTHPEALYGRRCQEAFTAAAQCRTDGFCCPSRQCMGSGESRRATFHLPAEPGTPARVEEVCASPVFNDEGAVIQVVEIWRDITERVQEETRQAEIERLESLGALASGFSHEVNTPLATTLTCAEAILGRIEDAERTAAGVSVPDIREIAETIRDQVLRCRKITEQFRRFSRGIPPASEPVDLGKVVASIISLVNPTAREAAVTIHADGPPPMPLVTANTEAVQHVLLNLLVNAIQSCRVGGGDVSVSYTVDSNVRVRIRDNGTGIAPDVSRGLFEPFRTSRPHGTGIGLFLSRGIMRRFGGDVRLVESEVGVGSCFEVSFVPAREATA